MRAGSNPACISSCLRGLKVPVDSMRRRQPHEHRPCVCRQPARATSARNAARSKCRIDHQGGAPARPSAPGTATPYTTPSSTPRTRRKRRQHLRRRHVLALPAVGLADAVDEVVEAASSRRMRSPVRYQESPSLKTLRSTLRAEASGVRISFESAGKLAGRAGIRPTASPTSFGAQRSQNPSPLRRGSPLLDVESQQSHGQAMREKGRNLADGAPAGPRSCRGKNCLRSMRSTRGSAGS